MIVTFIPAAGASSRMNGRDKLLQKVGAVSILRRTASEALAAKLGPVVIGVRSADRLRRKALRNLPVHVIEIEDAADGMAATLAAGASKALALIAEAYPGGGDYEYFGMCVMLPDMPGITRDDLTEMNQAFQASGGPIVRATTADGQHGHPVMFPDNLLHDFAQLSGDRGAATLIRGERLVEVALLDDRAILDLDTPEDWAAWRART